ncbi:MAG: hypothetical protein DMG10_28020 [Acidobacteria bacterium]|nr:MAG: hypothetical protein DMG10_28020 [Acidobacteriota bacterium]
MRSHCSGLSSCERLQLERREVLSTNLDLNTATEQELTGIQGIDKDHAKKIVEYRNQNGPFKSWEDLKRVPGMPVTCWTLKPHGCTVGGKAA